jgi:hypothetical protein
MLPFVYIWQELSSLHAFFVEFQNVSGSALTSRPIFAGHAKSDNQRMLESFSNARSRFIVDGFVPPLNG